MLDSQLTRMNGKPVLGETLGAAPMRLTLRKFDLSFADIVISNTEAFCKTHPFYKTIPFSTDKFRWFLERNVDKPDFFAWLVLDDDEPIAGLGAMIMHYAISDAKFATDLFQYIKPKYRSGIAFGMLVGLYVKWAESKGLHNCQVSYTGDKSKAFDRIIKRWDFNQFGTLYVKPLT